ncbi:SH3 domain-containing protein [Jannaschia donghaensis]|uniref:SH3 domain protein n=1 Tax=Jannaschia donghaensis TaxID=420998 RepID=A0A0M6YI96_9RHOB|nr:SH3 domain-containing protein [Jannaschia donghaensis]CTQ50082.1 SH3 domain protein [Jannaschia donghaensis]
MLKMTFTLAVALYAGFVIWGDPQSDLLTERSTRDTAIAAASAGEFSQPVIMTDDQAGAVVTRAAMIDTVVPDAATIAASAPDPSETRRGPRLIGEPVVVSLVEASAPITATDAGPAIDSDLYKVSGSRVNMRSGPSTANTVVDSLPGGTLTEMIGEVSDGWAEIRDVASGRTGYMAARFLEPA